MRQRIIPLLLLLAMVLPSAAQKFVNLTPRPLAMTVSDGELVVPAGAKVSCIGLTADMQNTVDSFLVAFNHATGLGLTVGNESEALLRIGYGGGQSDEGYTLQITADGIVLKAETADGLYYGLQTVKKILPANVMAGVPDATVTRYALPLVEITDRPRFRYRGFMLDVARHFFTVDEVKRMLDVMSYYKMNNFHWHLSDDQGWRVEIKKYPRLTTVGATASNSYVTDLKYGAYWTNAQYGPYFYTQDEIREVVRYAAERHITVTPEIDMPGHFVAAMAAYPEYSCTPGNPPTVWTSGGISPNVLNVANPEAVQFAKNILGELMDLFPGQTIHIGGDECPTQQWEGNSQCQAYYREHNLTSYRQLQSHFIKEMADFAAEHGRKIAVWDEAIAASGADVATVQSTGATVYCWTQGTAAASARKAATLGMDNIYTPWGPYYINRQQSTDACEESLPGDGSDNVERTYNEVPMPATGLTAEQQAHYTGVQGTFWTEHVADRGLMEYLALPRLIAIAETGWTPANLKNFADFRQRFTADTLLLNYGGYAYGRHYLLNAGGEADKPVMPRPSTDSKRSDYRIVTRATDTRSGRCMELLREGSPLISQYADKQAAAGVVWTAPQAAEGDDAYDYQWWSVEADPAGSGRYALVNRARPAGSVAADPTAKALTGRWRYDDGAKHYVFTLGDKMYGKADDTYYYTIVSANAEGQYLNASLGGQGFAVNCYTNPADGNSGAWTFVPAESAAGAATLAERVAAVRALAATAQTYANEAERRPGLFGREACEVLLAVIRNVDVEQMGEAELADFQARFDTALENFNASYIAIAEGKTYVITNAVKGFEGIALADKKQDQYLRHSDDIWQANAWRVSNVTAPDAEYRQTAQLTNVRTGRVIAAAVNQSSGTIGFPVQMGAEASNVRFTPDVAAGEYALNNGHNLFPLPVTSAVQPGIVSSGSTGAGMKDAVRPMGAAWNVIPVRIINYVCTDTEGRDFGTFSRSIPLNETNYTDICPEMNNHRVKSAAIENDTTVTVVYERTAYTVTTICRDEAGAYIDITDETHPMGETYTVALPEVPYYTLANSDYEDGAVLTPDSDFTIHVTYSTKAYAGVRRLYAPVTKVEAGHSYVFYDNSPDNNGARRGVRYAWENGEVYRDIYMEALPPFATWTLTEGTVAGTFRVKNNALDLFVPQMSTQPNPVMLSNAAENFSFTLNADGSWKIQGKSNGVCWDGLSSGALVGWTAPGHPYIIYEYFVQPCFRLEFQVVDTEGNKINEAKLAGDNYFVLINYTTFKNAGLNCSAYFDRPSLIGYTIYSIEATEGVNYEALDGNATIRYVLQKTVDGITTVNGNKTSDIIYDLYGRRLNAAKHPGVYIINGRKVVVK